MENQRLILFVALSVVIMLLYSAWQEQFAPQPTPPVTASTPGQQTTPPPPAQDIPGQPAVQQPSPGIPGSTSGVPTGADIPKTQRTPSQAQPQAGVLKSDQRIIVVTDLLRVEIDTVGGDIRRAALLTYPITAKSPDQPVKLLNDVIPYIFVAQSGLLSNNGPSVDHHTVYQSEQLHYELNDGENSLNVNLSWRDDSGVSVIKRYTFHRGDYIIDVKHEVNNDSSQTWSGRQYRQLQRTNVEDSNKSQFIYTYTGGVVSTPETPYSKVSFDEMATWKPEQSYTTGGWIAMIQHYFFAAWIPSPDDNNLFYSSVMKPNNIPEDDRYMLGMQSVENHVDSGQTGEFVSRLYVGPKEQKRLESIAPHLELTVDYGILTILAKPLFWLLDKIHGVVNNWGWAIIFVTLIIKLVFYKLSESSYRSMAKMRKFAPKVQAIRERYGNDKQRMSQAMMEIYKKEKVNPLGGCLPMIVQIPVFIALYWVLLESVELRQATFMLWIDDLSSKDPYYVLPLIMGVSMFIQQKLNPAPMDPIQQKVLSVLPIVFTLFFAFFPAGLVLYWVVNNILSIGQQWYITRKIENS